MLTHEQLCVQLVTGGHKLKQQHHLPLPIRGRHLEDDTPVARQKNERTLNV